MTLFFVLVSGFGIVLSQNAAAPNPQPPLCLMECVSEWISCEFDCRVEFPVATNFLDFQACAMPCEEERMMCMVGSSDPACNNNTLNNIAHLPFQVDLTPTTTPPPTTTPLATTAAPTVAPTAAPTPAPTPGPVAAAPQPVAAAAAAVAPAGPVAAPAKPVVGAGPSPAVAQPPQYKPVVSNPQPVALPAPSNKRRISPLSAVAGPQRPLPQVIQPRNIFAGSPNKMSYPRFASNSNKQPRFQGPMPAANQLSPNNAPNSAQPSKPVEQTKGSFGNRFLKVHKLSYNLNQQGK